MYSREQATHIKQEFWTTLGQYLSPLPSADGMKVNWINYKTGLRDVFFRMDADKRSARISIDLTHKDTGIQELFFQQFEEFKDFLHGTLGENWDWNLHTTDESGKTVSRIGTTLNNVSIFKKEDWPTLISFFKARIVALDEFWSSAKDGFDSLK